MLSALILYSRPFWTENRPMQSTNRSWPMSRGPNYNSVFNVVIFPLLIMNFWTFCGTQKTLKTDLNFIKVCGNGNWTHTLVWLQHLKRKWQVFCLGARISIQTATKSFVTMLQHGCYIAAICKRRPARGRPWKANHICALDYIYIFFLQFLYSLLPSSVCFPVALSRLTCT